MKYALTLTFTLMFLSPCVALAHGDSKGPSIDEHHQALKQRLMAQLGEAYEQPVEGLEDADLDAGMTLYTAQCATCHGDDGTGNGPASASLDPPPSNLTNGTQMNFISDAGFMEVLRSGLEGTSMPGYGELLTDEELVDVYAYSKTFRTYETEEDHACSLISPGHKPAPSAVLVLMFLALLTVATRRR